MSKGGKWRSIRPGEMLPGGIGLPAGGRGSGSTTTTTTTTRPSAFSSPATSIGGFQGVASTSTEKSLRLFNGRSRYDEWVFAPGQPRIVGRPIGSPLGTPGTTSGPRPGPTPLPGAGVPPGAGATGPALGPAFQPYVVPP